MVSVENMSLVALVVVGLGAIVLLVEAVVVILVALCVAVVVMGREVRMQTDVDVGPDLEPQQPDRDRAGGEGTKPGAEGSHQRRIYPPSTRKGCRAGRRDRR